MWLRQIFPSRQAAGKPPQNDRISRKACHFSVSEPMRYVYYVGYEQLHNEGGRFNSLHVTDLIRSTKASETGMILMELNQTTRRLRVFYIEENGKTSCSEIGDYQTLGFAPYTQPWENGALLSAFERLPTTYGRMAYTGRVIDVDVQSRKVNYTRPSGCPFTTDEDQEISPTLTAPHSMKQICRNGRLWVIIEPLHLKGKLVTIWTIHRGRWEYVTKVKANFRDITMDVSSNDTAIVLVKSPTESELSTTICISSVMLLRLR
ncbi:unnamed protein product [Nippostrongylus brasiliensis]|uniref:F5/8 type C domain-containing protein n=1 Tax=Nippostrongylus brasiliensis TaxID=27835 RepID=A0A158R1K8_NIPBR|nr:unnamed protein product [Nippostrongylus brasiliensis]